MKNRSNHILFLSCFIVLMLPGCLSQGKEYRPDQVIENALKSDDSFSYYAEYETIITENETEEITSISKEWMNKDGSMRVETKDENGTELIITNDMNTIQIYDTETNELMVGAIGDLDEIMYSPKEEMVFLIEGIQKTHTIEYIGEEEIIGRKTHHLKAIPRDKSSLNGEQEFWFDTEYGLGLKSTSSFGDHTSAITYTHFEITNDIDQKLFTMEQTDDMEIINLDEFDETYTITLDEMIDQVERPVWYIREDDSLQIEEIEVMEIEKEENYYTFEYIKEGLPFLSLMIENDTGFLHYNDNPEKLRVKDQMVYYNSMFDQDVYTWQKDGMQYEIWLKDPSIAQQEVLKLIEEMELLNKE